MLVALMAYDKDGALELRKANRDAGPFLNADGEMCGSLIILEVTEFHDAEKWAAADPYAHAGLFREMTLMPWNKVIG